MQAARGIPAVAKLPPDAGSYAARLAHARQLIRAEIPGLLSGICWPRRRQTAAARIAAGLHRDAKRPLQGLMARSETAQQRERLQQRLQSLQLTQAAPAVDTPPQ